MNLEGRVAIVTGGGSGIGRASARRLTAEGMQVCVVDVNRDAAAAVAAEIGGLSVGADVSERGALEAAFDHCVETFGGLDVAHLNAGVSQSPGDVAELDLDRYRRLLGVNVDHVVFGTGFAVRAMRRAGVGAGPKAVIATASMAGIDPFLPSPIYTLTKHAVVGFIRAIAPELAAEGIGAHAMCPGLTDTAQVPREQKAAIAQAGIELIAPEVIADAVVAAITTPLTRTGGCWIANPGELPKPWTFAEVPGAHARINLPNNNR